MRTAALRMLTGLSLIGLVLAASAPARAATVPISFDGTEQNFSATVDLTGNLHADGTGSAWFTPAQSFQPFKFTAPLNHPLYLYGPQPLKLNTDPKTDPLGTAIDVFYDSLADINDLDIDFLNGQTLDFSLDTISLTTNSKVSLVRAIFDNFDLSGTLSELRFDQTGIDFVTGGPGSGTFAVSGDVCATISNLGLTLGGLFYFPIEDQAVSLPTTLTGSWTRSGSGAWWSNKISLDGSLSIDVPLALISNLASDLASDLTDIATVTVSASFDLAASLTISFNYHLEDQLVLAPEPGSIVLLGIGLCAAAVPLARRLRRTWHEW